MKILIASDKYKDSLTAMEVCMAISEAIKNQNKSIEIQLCPQADGGDGSIAILSQYLDLSKRETTVFDPLLKDITATYLINNDIAYIELSKASGLSLLKKEERNAMLTSSFGTGQLILNAIQSGAKIIYLFIGGSATNDGGIGMAAALGYRFLNIKGEILEPIGKNLIHIHTIDDKNLLFDQSKVRFIVICDVINPVLGPHGATYQYALQKGVKKGDLEILEQGMKNLTSLFQQSEKIFDPQIPGTGAAGGIGAGSIFFLQAKVVFGTDFFIKLTGLECKIQWADHIITGEGKMDKTSIQGKVVSGVCNLAQKYNKPVLAICGQIIGDSDQKLGIKHSFSLLDISKNEKDAMENAIEKISSINLKRYIL